MVEITLENGTKGIGEGYLAVFAPRVFESIVELCTPYLIDTDGFDIKQRVRDLCRVCDYWSLQGAARHVISAVEIALADAKAKSLNIPVHKLYGDAKTDRMEMYGSGGICDTKEHFREELKQLSELGIGLYKIRAEKDDIIRTAWILEEAAKHGIRVGVDMCQNLADPPQKVKEVVDYVRGIQNLTDQEIIFLEESIGPADPEGFKALRRCVSPKVCGGEIITTPTRSTTKSLLKQIIYETSLIKPNLIEMIYQFRKEPGNRAAMLAIIRTGVSLKGLDPELIFIDQLEEIKAPILLLWGRNDKIVPVHHAEHAAKHFENIKSHIFERCGHWPHMEFPEEFNSLVEDFCAEV